MRRIGSALGVAALAAVAGCTSVTAGTSTPAPASGRKLDGAPHIAHPLATQLFQSQPCSTLPTPQLTALNIATEGSATFGAQGEGCLWGDDSEPGSFRAVLTYRSSGLSAVYAGRSGYQVFTVLPPIEGYPAVLDEQSDQRQYGGCLITVGVTDGVAVDVGLTVTSGQYANDPCALDTQFATDVVTDIKAGGGGQPG